MLGMVLYVFLFAAEPSLSAQPSPSALAGLKTALNLTQDAEVSLVRKLYPTHVAELMVVQLNGERAAALQSRGLILHLEQLFREAFAEEPPAADITMASENFTQQGYSIFRPGNPKPLIQLEK